MSVEFQNCTQKSKLGRFAAHSFDRAVSWPMGQLLTRHMRRPAIVVALAALCTGAAAGCRSDTPSEPATSAASNRDVPRGGELLASVRSEPRSFNRHAARDTTTNLVSNLTQAKLVVVNQATQAVEPSLAERWTTADDGRRVTMTLRRDVVFSDGQPFTADDVLFSFEAAYDEKSGSMLGDT